CPHPAQSCVHSCCPSGDRNQQGCQLYVQYFFHGGDRKPDSTVLPAVHTTLARHPVLPERRQDSWYRSADKNQNVLPRRSQPENAAWLQSQRSPDGYLHCKPASLPPSV